MAGVPRTTRESHSTAAPGMPNQARMAIRQIAARVSRKRRTWRGHRSCSGTMASASIAPAQSEKPASIAIRP